jgi:hypothetical protein
MHFCNENNITKQKQEKREWEIISREGRLTSEEI